MHELSLATELVETCTAHAAGRRVIAVKVRCPEALDPSELALAFEQLAAGGALEGASLEVETVASRLECSCGFEGAVEAAEAAGHLVVCPACGTVQPTANGLELLALRLSPSASRPEPFGPREGTNRPS